ncbi:MAG: OmpA family protein [Chitinophagales bacterium]|nr:OmpA family protein [Chitinophagales bacterium]
MRKLFLSIVLSLFVFISFAKGQDRLILPQPLTFKEHANDVTQNNDETLDFIADYLKQNPLVTKLLIECHVFTEASEQENLSLSLQRAAIVGYYLTEKGINCSRLIITGFGNSSPAVGATDNQDNTRIEFFPAEYDGKQTLDYNLNDPNLRQYDPCEIDN